MINKETGLPILYPPTPLEKEEEWESVVEILTYEGNCVSGLLQEYVCNALQNEEEEVRAPLEKEVLNKKLWSLGYVRRWGIWWNPAVEDAPTVWLGIKFQIQKWFARIKGVRK